MSELSLTALYAPGEEEEEPVETLSQTLPSTPPASPLTGMASPVRMNRRLFPEEPQSPSRSLPSFTAPASVTPARTVKKLRMSGAFSEPNPPRDLPRFTNEFEQVDVLGEGQFGQVFLCRMHIDKCLYAIKKIQAVDRYGSDKRAMKEVYAHTALSKIGAHDNIVRYYSVWREDKYLFIQNEYCDGGALAVGKSYPEEELWTIIRHVAQGLAFMHQHHLVHLDIKPGNIFIMNPSKSLGDKTLQLLKEDDSLNVTYYKLGDFGHLASAHAKDVVEGDCKYMSYELLQEDYNDLPRSDVYAFGMSIYELALGSELPANGDEWRRFRAEGLPKLPNYSDKLNDLIQRMTHPDITQRYTAADVLRVATEGETSEKTTPLLDEEKRKLQNELLKEQVKNADLALKLTQIKRNAEEAKLDEQPAQAQASTSNEPASKKPKMLGKLGRSWSVCLGDVGSSNKKTTDW